MVTEKRSACGWGWLRHWPEAGTMELSGVLKMSCVDWDGGYTSVFAKMNWHFIVCKLDLNTFKKKNHSFLPPFPSSASPLQRWPLVKFAMNLLQLVCNSIRLCERKQTKGFPGGWVARGKESAYQEGDLIDVGLMPGLRWSPGGRNCNLRQYSCLENPMNSRAGRPWGCKQLDTTKNACLQTKCFHFSKIGIIWHMVL